MSQLQLQPDGRHRRDKKENPKKGFAIDNIGAIAASLRVFEEEHYQALAHVAHAVGAAMAREVDKEMMSEAEKREAMTAHLTNNPLTRYESIFDRLRRVNDEQE